MASPKSTKTQSEPREYTVSLTEKGAAYVHYYQLGQQAAREEEQIHQQRIAAKLAVAAAQMQETLSMAGDPLSASYDWKRYANCCGNDADRGW